METAEEQEDIKNKKKLSYFERQRSELIGEVSKVRNNLPSTTVELLLIRNDVEFGASFTSIKQTKQKLGRSYCCKVASFAQRVSGSKTDILTNHFQGWK